MNSLYLRSMAAIACAAGLAACGGGNSGNLILGGSVTGLGAKAGLVLTNGSSTLPVAAGSGSFQFVELIDTNANYDVQIKTQPTGAVCTVVSGTGAGKASNYNVTTVQISCLINQYKLGGTIAGIAGPGLILLNGKDSVQPTANGAFTFPGTVGDGSPYGVSMLPSSIPTGKTCTVANPVGTMGSADINNILVTCS
ncbi:hypothetical protein AAKU55_001322 [Oxalobacteraceae bacterium GrIS 1.11]